MPGRGGSDGGRGDGRDATCRPAPSVGRGSFAERESIFVSGRQEQPEWSLAPGGRRREGEIFDDLARTVGDLSVAVRPLRIDPRKRRGDPIDQLAGRADMAAVAGQDLIFGRFGVAVADV